jgi:hypothetical protein
MAGKTIMEATPVPVDLVVSCVDGMPDGATVKIETSMDECVKRLCEKIECKLRLTAGQYMLYHNGRVVNKYCYDWQVVRDWVGIANPTLLYDTDAFPKSVDLTCPPLPFRACPCLALLFFLSCPVLSCPFLAWPSVPFALLGGSAVAKCAPPRSWILTFPYPPCPWMLSLSVLPPFPCKSLPFLAGAAE